MKIVIGSDHAAWEAKTDIVAELRQAGHQVDDVGTYNAESCDYPVFAYAVAHRVASGDCERGVLLCGTGIGMSIAANRVKGVRAAVAFNEETARLCREHNDANVICLGARLLPTDEIITLIEAFLETEFGGDRHAKRVAMFDTPPDPSTSNRPA